MGEALQAVLGELEAWRAGKAQAEESRSEGRLAGTAGAEARTPIDGGRPLGTKRHICTVPARGPFAVERSGRVLKVHGLAPMKQDGTEVEGGRKQAVKGWSTKSRLECFRTFAAVDWPEQLVFLSLTYPGDLAKCPHTGQEGQKHLRAFRLRWVRKYGPEAWLGAWKREFQRRGALHYHLWLKWPEKAFYDDLRAFVVTAWNDIVAPGDDDHLYAGAKVEEWEGDPTRYVLKEMGLGAGKWYQNEVPDWFEKPGRFWGLFGLEPKWEAVDLSQAEAVKVRRTARRYLAARGVKVHERYRFQGLTCVVNFRETVDRIQGVGQGA